MLNDVGYFNETNLRCEFLCNETIILCEKVPVAYCFKNIAK